MMSLSETLHQIKYSLIPKDGGILLSIWEPAPVTTNRAKPFLFMVRQKLSTEAEARELLDHYLNMYKAISTARDGYGDPSYDTSANGVSGRYGEFLQ